MVVSMMASHRRRRPEDRCLAVAAATLRHRSRRALHLQEVWEAGRAHPAAAALLSTFALALRVEAHRREEACRT